jgi:hypothetical protein
VTAVLLLFSGCTSEARTTDAAGTAVRDTHSAIAGLVLALQLRIQDRATTPMTQVSLDRTLEAVATAQQELLTATDTDPQRRTAAAQAIHAAAEALVGLGDRGAGELTQADLAALQKVEQDLAAAAKELRA